MRETAMPVTAAGWAAVALLRGTSPATDWLSGVLTAFAAGSAGAPLAAAG